jgi:hypothetical protein
VSTQPSQRQLTGGSAQRFCSTGYREAFWIERGASVAVAKAKAATVLRTCPSRSAFRNISPTARDASQVGQQENGDEHVGGGTGQRQRYSGIADA